MLQLTDKNTAAAGATAVFWLGKKEREDEYPKP